MLNILITIGNTVRIFNPTVSKSKIDQLLNLILKSHLLSIVTTILYSNIWYLRL